MFREFKRERREKSVEKNQESFGCCFLQPGCVVVDVLKKKVN
ncbi:unnamed protein product [Brassica oleracea]